MWYIEKKKNPEDKVFFLVEEECIVGRKDAKLLIDNDQSISRKHAQLVLTCRNSSGNDSDVSKLKLIDFGSKYGTSVNGVKLRPDDDVILSNNDIIIFGKLDSIWKVKHDPLVITTSCSRNSDKAKLKSLVAKLGGQLVSEWNSNCTYLVMNTIMVTVKTVCALASMKHIVHPSFLSDAIEQISSNSKFTAYPDKFIPPVGESSLKNTNVSFIPDSKRCRLFESKRFIFMDSSQKERLKESITLAKGSCELVDFEDLTSYQFLLEPNVCVMNYIGGSTQTIPINSQQKGKNADISSFLKRNKKRFIQDSEIGLAIVYMSTDSHCNPEFNMNAMLLAGNSRLQSQSFSQQPVIASETQDTDLIKDSPMSRKRKSKPNHNDLFSKVPKFADNESNAAYCSPSKPICDDPITELKIISENRVSSNDAKENSNTKTLNEEMKTVTEKTVNTSSLESRHPTSPFLSKKSKSETNASNCNLPTKNIIQLETDKKIEENIAENLDFENRPPKNIEVSSKGVKRHSKNEKDEESVGYVSACKKIKDEKDEYGEGHHNTMVKIELKYLLRPKNQRESAEIGNEYDGMANFKFFKKKKNASSARKYINISELVPYLKNTEYPEDLDEWCDSDNSENEVKGTKNKFNWDGAINSLE